MKRRARPEELQLWAKVAETVKPLPGRRVAKAEAAAAASEPEAGALPPKLTGRAAQAKAVKAARPSAPPPQTLEPNRARRVVREREPIAGRIDLHGMTLDRARPALEAFVFAAVERGDRMVLVITGKGVQGEGLLRRMTPEWLSSPPLRPLIAGVQPADRRHGGDGALYVALKRGR